MELTMAKHIVLELPEGNRLLSGKEVGMRARKDYDLDKLDNIANGYIQVDIKAPIVTSSFILGMFSESVKKLGVEKFWQRYRFDANPEVMSNIQINVEYSATDLTALS